MSYDEVNITYFHRYGPATIRDAAWWSGLSATDVAAALRRSQRPLVTVATPWSAQPCLMFADQAAEAVTIHPNTQGNEMQPLNLGASLPDIQDYVRRMEAERGLDHQDLSSQCLKLGEEVGELYRAVRKLQGNPQDPHGRTADVGDEAVDALILLMSIVNRCDVNLEDAFRAKEARNETRVWA